MFFRGKLIKRLENENEYLRKENSKLIDRILALTNRDALYDIKNVESDVPAPSYIDPMGKIRSIEAKTDEEKQQKRESEEFFKTMFGG